MVKPIAKPMVTHSVFEFDVESSTECLSSSLFESTKLQKGQCTVTFWVDKFNSNSMQRRYLCSIATSRASSDVN